MEIIQLEQLTKNYNGKPVLKQIDKSFSKGVCTAFIGRNGCGKSTFLKCIAKLVVPSTGKVIYKKPLLFHYIPEKFPATPLSARSFLTRLGEIDGLSKQENAEIIQTLAKDFYMEDLLDTPMKQMSKGTLQKVGVIQALMKQPEVLLLDEPLSGQDEASKQIFIQKMNNLKQQGVTLFLACHERELVNQLADEIYTLDQGILVQENVEDMP